MSKPCQRLEKRDCTLNDAQVFETITCQFAMLSPIKCINGQFCSFWTSVFLAIAISYKTRFPTHSHIISIHIPKTCLRQNGKFIKFLLIQVFSFNKFLAPKCFQESISVIKDDTFMKTLYRNFLSFSLVTDLDVPAKTLQGEQQNPPV